MQYNQKRVRDKKRKLAELFLHLAGFKEHEKFIKILDIGCGEGEYCHYYSNRYEIDCIGIDISEKFIDTAIQNTPDGVIRVPSFLVADCKVPPSFILGKNFDLILFVGSRVVDLARYSKAEIYTALEAYRSLLCANGKIVIYELTDFSGTIESKAGWHYKTFDEINWVAQAFPGTTLIFMKGVSKLWWLYYFTLFRKIINLVLQKERKAFGYLDYVIIIPSECHDR
jgi:cyclopropane fatty-acyl-phospholipid synthase-like methyltransferase